MIQPIEAGGETPGGAFERIATLLDEVERTATRNRDPVAGDADAAARVRGMLRP